MAAIVAPVVILGLLIAIGLIAYDYAYWRRRARVSVQDADGRGKEPSKNAAPTTSLKYIVPPEANVAEEAREAEAKAATMAMTKVERADAKVEAARAKVEAANAQVEAAHLKVIEVTHTPVKELSPQAREG